MNARELVCTKASMHGHGATLRLRTPHQKNERKHQDEQSRQNQKDAVVGQHTGLLLDHSKDCGACLMRGCCDVRSAGHEHSSQ